MKVFQFHRVYSGHSGNVLSGIYRYLLINRSFDYELAKKVKTCISLKISMATVSMETRKCMTHIANCWGWSIMYTQNI